ncbi:MAG: hypothetical protein NUW22_06250 [Acidobacteria bacterium]|nr:hypothetical protein [Acidobacteriota bacterium]
MTYRPQYVLAVSVTVLLAILGAIQAGDAATLGLSRQVIAWLGIASAGLGVLNGLLPRITAPPNDARKGMD